MQQVAGNWADSNATGSIVARLYSLLFEINFARRTIPILFVLGIPGNPVGQ